jgi:hypothetical protein
MSPTLRHSLGNCVVFFGSGWLEVLMALLADTGLTTLRYWDRLRRNAKGFRRAASELYRRSWIVPSGWIVRAYPVYLCVKARRGRPLAS